MEVNELVQMLGEWSQKTFNPTGKTNKYSRLVSMFRKLTEEIQELSQELSSPMEIADCVMLLMDMAYLNKIDLESAIIQKLNINRERKWSEPDKNGVVRHKGDLIMEIHPCANCGAPIGLKAEYQHRYNLICSKCGSTTVIEPHQKG